MSHWNATGDRVGALYKLKQGRERSTERGRTMRDFVAAIRRNGLARRAGTAEAILSEQADLIGVCRRDSDSKRVRRALAAVRDVRAGWNHFGTDFSRVRIRDTIGPAARRHACTPAPLRIGSDIYFNAGEYDPHSRARAPSPRS